MILDAKSGLRGVLVNSDTGERIPFAFWADTETGHYRAWQATPDGRAIAYPKTAYSGVARLKFFASAPATKPSEEPVPEEHRRRAVEVPADVDAECEVDGCHQPATWITGDEQITTPAVVDGEQFERGVIVRGHYFCNRHYRLPISTSLRGVESEVQVAARPQWRSL